MERLESSYGCLGSEACARQTELEPFAQHVALELELLGPEAEEAEREQLELRPEAVELPLEPEPLEAGAGPGWAGPGLAGPGLVAAHNSAGAGAAWR